MFQFFQPVHALKQATRWLAFVNADFELGGEYANKGFYQSNEIMCVAVRWDDWKRLYPADIDNFVSRGNLDSIDPEFAQELDRALRVLVRRKNWSSASKLRKLTNRLLLVMKFALSLSVMVHPSARNEPETREDIRALYVQYFEQVNSRFCENLTDEDKTLMRFIADNLLSGAYAHHSSVGPYNDSNVEGAAARRHFEMFTSTSRIEQGPNRAETVLPFKFLKIEGKKPTFEMCSRRVDGLRRLYRDYMLAQRGGHEWLTYLSSMDLHIGRRTLKAPRPQYPDVFKNVSIRETLEGILSPEGPFANGNHWKKSLQAFQNPEGTDFDSLFEHSLSIAHSNQLVAQSTVRFTQPEPNFPSPTQHTMSPATAPMSIDTEETKVEERSQERLMILVERHATDIGEQWRMWTLCREEQSNGTNKIGAKIMTGSMYHIGQAIVRVGVEEGEASSVERWLRGLDSAVTEEMSEVFFLWIVNVCQPGKNNHLVSFSTWFDARLENTTRYLWSLLREIAGNLGLSTHKCEKFPYLVLSTAIGMNYIRAFVNRTEDFVFDVQHSSWRTWRKSFGGLIQERPSASFNKLLRLVALNGLFVHWL